MRQVFLEKGTVCVQNVARPQLNPWSVLVAVRYSFVSSGMEASAIANAKRSPLFSNVPHKIKMVLAALSGQKTLGGAHQNKYKGTFQALGYSCSGQVIAVGAEVTTFRPGDFVACAGAEFAHHADIVCVPENLVVRVKEKNLKESSATALGAIALQAIRRASLQIGETVCVMGLGLLGQLALQLAKQAGCKVIGIDIIEHRLEVAKQFGADAVFLADAENLEESVQFITNQQGVDCTLITASGQSNEIVQRSMNITRKRGKVVVVGDVGLKLEREPFYKKEIDFLISRLYGPGKSENPYQKKGVEYPYSYVRWTEKRNMEAVADLINKKVLKVDGLAHKEFSIDDATKAYEAIKTKKAIGVILSYKTQKEPSFIPAVKEKNFNKPVAFSSLNRDILRVGVVGTGTRTRERVLPLLSSIEDVEVSAVCDVNIVAAKNAAQSVGAKRTFTDEVELFQQKNIDVVYLASPDKFHFDQAFQALSAGKAVFMQRPMVTSFHEFNVLKKFLENNPQAPFCVDYSRSFSPFIEKIKWEVMERYSPLVAHYRINAGYKHIGDRQEGEGGAGRIIADACHIFDLFCFLTGAEPVALSVESLKPQSDSLFPTDNFSVQVSFNDGSICSLLYTCLGHPASESERMEVFFDSKSIVLQDFKHLKGFGTSRAFDETIMVADRGHRNLFESFFEGIRKEKPVVPISFARLQKAAELALVTDQLVCEGGGTKEFIPQASTREVPVSGTV